MQRYFINEALDKKKEFTLPKDDLHHLAKVMRSVDGTELICVDNQGMGYHCIIKDITQGIIAIDHIIEQDNELDVGVTLVYALPKGDKFEFVLQKATELGVRRIVPLLSRRCVVKSDQAKFAKKLERYQKILKEAAQQSKRNRIPEIVNVIKLADLANYQSDFNLVAYEEMAKAGKHMTLRTTLDSLQAGDTITVVVGSEGGFDEDEVKEMEEQGFKACSLGKRILRSETAPLYLLSVIGCAREIK